MGDEVKYSIPFNMPFIAGQELYYIAQSVLNGQISGDGPFSRKCQEFMEEAFDARNILMTTSCTSALEMACILCDLEQGDEVILPSYTFVSTVNALMLRGARPVFVDIRPDTKNLDEGLIENAVTDRTKAIIPVHYAGVSCEMDTINRLAAKHELFVIEDAAQGVNSRYRGRYLGTLGDFGAYSFHETKNFICGEGGAILVNNPDHVQRAEIIREKGTNRSQFFRGQVDKYTWVDMGSSYVSSDLLAAFLYGQLEHMEEITAKRKGIYEQYQELMQPLADEGFYELPFIPEECDSNYHMFHILLRDLKTRSALIDHLKARGILAVFHYVPLHTSPVGLSLGYQAGQLPVTEQVSDRLLRLPFYFSLSEADVGAVVEGIRSFFKT